LFDRIEQRTTPTIGTAPLVCWLRQAKTGFVQKVVIPFLLESFTALRSQG
jgi:hypothetical protein